jgi:hypothetical protein
MSRAPAFTRSRARRPAITRWRWSSAGRPAIPIISKKDSWGIAKLTKRGDDLRRCLCHCVSVKPWRWTGLGLHIYRAKC